MAIYSDDPYAQPQWPLFYPQGMPMYLGAQLGPNTGLTSPDQQEQDLARTQVLRNMLTNQNLHSPGTPYPSLASQSAPEVRDAQTAALKYGLGVNPVDQAPPEKSLWDRISSHLPFGGPPQQAPGSMVAPQTGNKWANAISLIGQGLAASAYGHPERIGPAMAEAQANIDRRNYRAMQLEQQAAQAAQQEADAKRKDALVREIVGEPIRAPFGALPIAGQPQQAMAPQGAAPQGPTFAPPQAPMFAPPQQGMPPPPPPQGMPQQGAAPFSIGGVNLDPRQRALIAYGLMNNNLPQVMSYLNQQAEGNRLFNTVNTGAGVLALDKNGNVRGRYPLTPNPKLINQGGQIRLVNANNQDSYGAYPVGMTPKQQFDAGQTLMRNQLAARGGPGGGGLAADGKPLKPAPMGIMRDLVAGNMALEEYSKLGDNLWSFYADNPAAGNASAAKGGLSGLIRWAKNEGGRALGTTKEDILKAQNAYEAAYKSISAFSTDQAIKGTATEGDVKRVLATIPTQLDSHGYAVAKLSEIFNSAMQKQRATILASAPYYYVKPQLDRYLQLTKDYSILRDLQAQMGGGQNGTK